MSYILDALRRADAEREKGSVPGLHAHQPASAPAHQARPHAAIAPWTWLALGAVAGPLIALAWYYASQQGARVATGPVPAVAPAPAMRTPTVEPAAPAGPVAMPAPVPAPITEPRRAAGSTTRQAPETNAVPATAGNAAPRIMAREELPDAVRRALPELVAGGSIYSSNPANRSLIINGRLYREGDAVGDDLSLAEIGLKSAVLRYKDYLFEIRF